MEPIAIVGMACRFPGATSPAAYWEMLLHGVEAVAEPPAARPELEPPPWLVEQAPHCRRGGFLEHLDRFEPGFFRISPREAARMDPQQRLLLEVAWEALEDAGQPVSALSGTSAGVFVGVMNADFARRHAQDLSQIDAQLGPGSSLGIAPNRLSFFLDLRGPSLAVDTLCSSSLVAIHLACQSLLTDESSPLAIAGGVNVILDRTMDVFYARAGLLSGDGRCRAFDAGARGIVRGEGVGLLVLKRLSRARADGDRVHAVILGSAVNQDGRSNGLTSPSRWSQEEVLRTAYRRAGVSPSDVPYVEAHGTGTLIGDPIETAALGAVLGEGRAATGRRPCAIGSVKTNLGHLESAAGVASLFKAALSLEHRTLTPSLNFEAPNPYARLDERGLAVQTRAEAWPEGELVAGVSSFGMGGTNAHVVLGGVEAEERVPETKRAGAERSERAYLVPLSARSVPALDELERRVLELLASGEVELADVAHTAGVRRDHHDHRRALVLRSATDVAFVTSGSVAPGRERELADVGAHPATVEGLRAIAALYCRGFDVDWKLLDAKDARFVPIGTYPWQREHSWLELAAPPAATVLPDGMIVPEWVRASAPSKGANSSARRGGVLLLGEGGSGAEALVARLTQAGRSARLVASSTALASLAEVAGADAPSDVVLFCGPELATTVRLVQALARRGESLSARLWLVTRGACIVEDEGNLASLTSAKVWGLGRVAANEHPRLRCTLVDLAQAERATDADMLFAELASDGDELEVAIRATNRYVARLGRRPLVEAKSKLQLRADAAYLVTGGLGGLGLAAARRLADRGARTLVLLGRRGAATDEARRAVAELGSRGVNVVVERADVSDRAAIGDVLNRHRVRGVIHAAGVMSPAMIAAIEPDQVDASLAAKVEGARNLHELTASQPLDFFVLYSSVATLLGMHGQGAYAAGNAYLDALAHHRRARGLAATSVAWTVIEDTGMAANAGKKALRQLADRGVSSLPVRAATDLLERLLAVETPAHVGAVSFDLTRWAAFTPHARSMPRLQPLAAEEPSMTEAARGEVLRALPLPERVQALELYLCKVAAEVLQLSEALAPERSLLDLGIDSLTALELQTMLESALEITVPSERLLRGPSARELATELAATLGGETSDVVARPPVSFHLEGRLDEALGFVAHSRARPSQLLLTGATGFLGAFVLAELLERSEATIACLVRGKSAEDGMRRLEGVLGRYGLSALDLRARVRCVPGDLSQPGLGLAGAEWDRLAGSIDTVVHSGASVNFVFPYEALKASNVGGTHEVLRLCAAARARLHHVSTIGIFPGGPANRERVYEDARPSDPERLPLGYMRAKWVAETLVVQARERGLDASIYRPGTIAGHSSTGAFNPDDFVCALIKGCVELGLAPRVDTEVNLAPVDYVSRALVRIALAERSASSASPGPYHLVGPRPVAFRDLVGWLRALGYRLEELPYDEWRRVLVERAEATGNALTPLLPLFVAHEGTDWLHLPPYDDAETSRALVGSGIACPEVDASLVRRWVERFVVSGYLPRPR